jgi:hypothetical protein
VADRVIVDRAVIASASQRHTKPVDFHSWRRGYVQGLATADVNAQQAAALAGNADLGAHTRYLANTR